VFFALDYLPDWKHPVPVSSTIPVGSSEPGEGGTDLPNMVGVPYPRPPAGLEPPVPVSLPVSGTVHEWSFQTPHEPQVSFLLFLSLPYPQACLPGTLGHSGCPSQPVTAENRLHEVLGSIKSDEDPSRKNHINEHIIQSCEPLTGDSVLMMQNRKNGRNWFLPFFEIFPPGRTKIVAKI